MDILENNIKFKILLNDCEEETTTPTNKQEIFLQMSLLSEILEKKLEILKKTNNKACPDFEKLKEDTGNLLKKYRKLKFVHKDNSIENLAASMYSDNYDQSFLEEEKLHNIEEIVFDRDAEIKDLLVSLQNLNKISQETGEIIFNNQEKLDLIEVDTQKSKVHTGQAVQEIKVAAIETIKRRKNYLKLIFAGIGGLIGIQAGPVGVAVGGVAGGCVGGVASLGLNPLKSKIKKIDEKK